MAVLATVRVVHLQHLLTDSAGETTLSLLEMRRRESTPASLSCLRGYHSNMAPGTVKRAITEYAQSMIDTFFPDIETNAIGSQNLYQATYFT